MVLYYDNMTNGKFAPEKQMFHFLYYFKIKPHKWDIKDRCPLPMYSMLSVIIAQNNRSSIPIYGYFPVKTQ